MGMGFFLSVIRYGMQLKLVVAKENVYGMDVVEGEAKYCWAFLQIDIYSVGHFQWQHQQT